ncbi:MAG: succinylglutamate desuccinylase/aspartoacylase family protein [Natronomonas sp.]
MEYAPVSHQVEKHRLGLLPSGDGPTVAVHRYDGGVGPTVYLQATQHGIEINGPAVLRRLHERLLEAEIAGTVVSVPVSNPLAFDQRTYMTPPAFDVVNPNLNRIWPGDENGTMLEQLVARLWEFVADADAVVDLHTGTPDMLEHVRFQNGDTAAEELAEAFGSEFLLAGTDETTAVTESGGKLRTVASAEGIPTIVPELSNSRCIDHEAAERGVSGIENVLRTLDVLPGATETPTTPTRLKDVGENSVAAASGLFEPRPDLSVGDEVATETRVGTIYCPSTFETRQTVSAPERGVVYSLTREATVMAGERLAGIATVV